MSKYWTIATDAENNDIFLDGLNNIGSAEDAEALASIVMHRQRTVLGELRYNTSAGIPYFTTVFATPPDLRMFEAFIIADTQTIPGVIGVDSFNVSVRDNTVKFDMRINTEFGRIAVNG